MHKDVFYFTHDSNARHDPKIVAMRAIYGFEGYGWYWAIIEMLREDSDLEFPLTELQVNGLVVALDTNIEMLKKYIKDCVELGLFYTKAHDERKFLSSESLDRRISKYKEIKQLRSAAGKKGNEARWGANRKRIANASQSLAKKGKERKEEYKDIVEQVVTDLNLVCKTNYKTTTEKTKKLIIARISEGFTVENFKLVHRNKASEWLGDKDWSKFLRPETLYGSKFESYLNQKTKRKEIAI